MKRFIAPLVIILALAECNHSDHFTKAIGIVNIPEFHMPGGGQVHEKIGIHAKAEATNGCWSDLVITMSKTDTYHFLLKGTGLFSGGGICPQVMVYKDTIINFEPGLPGKYFFQINESPLKVMRDTLEIN